jgi:hypothetical protein
LITAAPFRRTIKIICGISVCPFILSLDWVTASDAADILLEEKNFILQDKNINLEQSLERSRSKKLFEGMKFFATPNTIPEPKQLKLIIECAGGTMLEKISDSSEDKIDDSDELDTSQLMIVTCLPDRDYCENRLSQVNKSQFVTTNFLIDSVCKQEIVSPKDPFSTDESEDEKQEENNGNKSPNLFGDDDDDE